MDKVTIRGALLFVASVFLSLTQPAAALEVCRPNALGQIACFGAPTRGLEPLRPYASTKTGLSRVQRRPGASAEPALVPSYRTNSFGDTVLREAEVPRPKPRFCRTDSFDNLRC